MKTMRMTISLVAVLLAAVVPSGLAATADRPVSRLVLEPRDVGAAYVPNQELTRPRTFSEAAAGDSAAVRRAIRRTWVGGYQSGFVGVRVPWGIVSTTDVFRTGDLGTIVTAWHADLVRQLHARRLPVPAGAPGTRRLLLAAKVPVAGRTVEVKTYAWQRGRAFATVHLTGVAGKLRLALLMSLARRQDAKLRAGLDS
jgi:hypothetical protein